MASSEANPESRIGYEDSLYRYLNNNMAAASIGSKDKSSDTEELDSAAQQGVGYLDYFQDDASTLSELALRRRLALQRALRRRNGVAAGLNSGVAAKLNGLGASDFDSAGLSSNDLADLTGAGALTGSPGLAGLSNRDSGLLGLGSDYGHDTYSSGVSGYGVGYAPSTQCNTGLNPLLLVLTAAIAIAGFYFMYTRLTVIPGKRKKRDDDNFGLIEPLISSVIYGGSKSPFACLSLLELKLLEKYQYHNGHDFTTP